MGCHGSPSAVNVAASDLHLVVYVESDTEASGQFLGFAPDASSGTQFRANAEAQSGLSQSASTLQGGAPEIFTITAKETLHKAYYLNLSKPINGTLYWSSQAANTLREESTQIRIEIFQGTKRIGGAEYGFDVLMEALIVPTGKSDWIPFPFHFRPEVATLQPNQTLSMKVSRSSGLADFMIGTGGDHQSFMDFSYFDSDPLEGALYLERGHIVTSTITTTTSEGETTVGGFVGEPGGDGASPPTGPASLESLAAAGLGTLPMVGLLALSNPAARRRTRMFLVVALLLLFSLSGCFSNGEQAGISVQPNSTLLPPSVVDVEYVDNETLASLGKGAMEGLVTTNDQVPLVVAGAHISILATSLSTDTDAHGRFAFGNLTPNTYVVRVESKDQAYPALEKQIPIVTGKVARVTIRLAKDVLTTGAQQMHQHDLWGGQTKLDWQTVNFALTGTATAAGTYCSPVSATTTSTVYTACDTFVPIDSSKPIISGTGRVEVVLSWSTAGDAPQELGLRVTTSGNRSVDQYFVPRGPSQPFNVAMFPSEADPGHQAFTDWTFTIYAVPLLAWNPVGPAVFKSPDIEMKVTIHKTVVPFEPAHRDFWNGKTEIELLKVVEKSTCWGCDQPNAAQYWGIPTIPKPLFVPPGTKELKGTLSWSYDNDLPFTTDWGLLYKPANVAASDWKRNIKPASMSGSGQARDFVIAPTVEEPDQFYQLTSNWRFYLDDKADPIGSDRNTSPYTHFKLTLTAYKDPTWVDK